jgi:hypothetical protein
MDARMNRSLPFLILALLAPVAAGCGSLVEDRIDTICNCEDCGDNKREEFEIIVNSDYDVAATYDCIELIEPYWECQLERHECQDRNYSDDNDECGSEREQYFQCLDAKSSRDLGPY